jgi:biofilm PGA synthesis N-glycosyltransferase PgaC
VPRPSATVLIPAHDEAATIGDLVVACQRQAYPVEEIIVVADACSDDTAQVARRAGATVIETNFKDKAAAQNAALWSIRSDCVIGFDGDTVPADDCIELMMRDIERGFDATCATVLPIQPKGFFIRARRFAYALGRRWWRLCQAKVGRIQVLTGAAYVFKTAAIKSIGGFPNGLISADMDATWALHKARYRLGYAGSAIAYTYDPETFTVYRQQMRRWGSGYFQNMAKYRRELLHWRAMLVVWTALFDLCSLFWAEGVLGYSVLTGAYGYLRVLLFWVLIHQTVTVILVASVVGIKEAVLGVVPYTIVNFYNKWLYFCAFVREWVLGRHYASWTGRQGRKTVITPMTTARKIGLAGTAATLACGGGIYAVVGTDTTVSPRVVAGPQATWRPSPTPTPTMPAGVGAAGRVRPAATSAAEVAAPPATQVYYRSCAMAAAAGALPLVRGDRGYRRGLDRDGDGVACEPSVTSSATRSPRPHPTTPAAAATVSSRATPTPSVTGPPSPSPSPSGSPSLPVPTPTVVETP